MTGSSISRGRRLLMTFMLLAMVATGVALSAGGIAVAKKQPNPPATTDAYDRGDLFPSLEGSG
jgi:hypothetical protein